MPANRRAFVFSQRKEQLAMPFNLFEWLVTATFLGVLAFFRLKPAPKKDGGGSGYKLAEHGYLTLREKDIVVRAIQRGLDAGYRQEDIRDFALATLNLEREHETEMKTTQDWQCCGNHAVH
jgi:hypothetical protein